MDDVRAAMRRCDLDRLVGEALGLALFCSVILSVMFLPGLG